MPLRLEHLEGRDDGRVLRLGRHELKALLDRALGELEEEGALDSLRREFGVIRDSDWPVGTRR